MTSHTFRGLQLESQVRAAGLVVVLQHRLERLNLLDQRQLLLQELESILRIYGQKFITVKIYIGKCKNTPFRGFLVLSN
jgi:hypothetical protein